MTISEQLDLSFGDGPEHEPIAAVLRAGRRRVVRRRAGVAVATAVVVVVVTAGVALTGGDDTRGRDVPAVSDPSTPTASATPTLTDPTVPETTPPRNFHGELAIVGDDGQVILNPRAVIVDRADVRYDGELAYLFEGRLRGETLYQFATADGGMSATDDTVAGTIGLRAWGAPMLRGFVEANGPGAEPPDAEPGIEVPPPAPPGLVSFRDGRLVPADGVTITDEVGGIELPDFAEPGQPTAAARFRYEGAVYFLVARPENDVIAVEAPPGVNTLTQWLVFAQTAYASGSGLR